MAEFLSGFSSQFIWFVIGLLLLLAELMIPGLIIFFFGVGAWAVALILLFFDISVNMQLLIFLVVSIVLLFLLREKFNAMFQGFVKEKQPKHVNLDDLSGGTAKTLSALEPGKEGEVEYHGTVWKARSDEKIDAGEEVKVIRVDNLTLYVTQTREE